MAGDRPSVWKAVDAAERLVAPRLERAAQSAAFAEVLGAVTRAQAAVRRGVEARSRGLWHLVNLPAASDVTRLRRQVGSLERELRRVSVAVERALAQQDRTKEIDDARNPGGRRAARAQRPAGPDAPRRRAQRAAGS